MFHSKIKSSGYGLPPVPVRRIGDPKPKQKPKAKPKSKPGIISVGLN